MHKKRPLHQYNENYFTVQNRDIQLFWFLHLARNVANVAIEDRRHSSALETFVPSSSIKFIIYNQCKVPQGDKLTPGDILSPVHGVWSFSKWSPGAILDLVQTEMAPSPKTPLWNQTGRGSEDALQSFGHLTFSTMCECTLRSVTGRSVVNIHTSYGLSTLATICRRCWWWMIIGVTITKIWGVVAISYQAVYIAIKIVRLWLSAHRGMASTSASTRSVSAAPTFTCCYDLRTLRHPLGQHTSQVPCLDWWPVQEEPRTASRRPLPRFHDTRPTLTCSTC